MLAIAYVLCLLLVTILGAYLCAYAAHCYLTVAQQTAAGNDEVVWPDDPWFEWVSRAAQLLLVVAFWLVPVGFVLRAVAPGSGAAAVSLSVGVPAALFWLLFPVILLSAFSGASLAAVFRAEVLSRLPRGGASAVAFYASTLPLCLAGAAVLREALSGRLGFLMALLPAVLFLHARLVGRLARVLGRVRLPRKKSAHRPGKVLEHQPGKRNKGVVEVEDPWMGPEERQLRGSALPVEGYDLADDGAAVAPAAPAAPLSVEGYDVRDEPPPPRLIVERADVPPVVAPSKGGHEPPLPRHPFVSGVYTFLVYGPTLPPLVLLTVGFAAWGGLYTLLGSLRPF